MAETDVVSHYGSNAIAARILAAVGKQDGGDLSPEMLFPYDQLHGRELAATRDHVERLAPQDDWRIIDIGSGVGGPARFVAAMTGARVTGIDLTPQFVEASIELTARVGLSEKADYVVGNATALPFADGSFDAAICFYVGMNVAAKTAVLQEIQRVLKPGGRLLWTEVVAGSGDPQFPLPWARMPEASHVVDATTLRQNFLTAGFEILDWADETDAHVELALAAQRAGVRPTAEQIVVNEIVLGADFVERRRNYIKSLAAGALRSVAVLAHTKAR
ncbi:MAG: class I SAM-dependent methyltransferase [Mesorhizobium sp.]|nr:MAG: class I SAM-dependent methyltransferase [Mesorhizobium sp.]